jgi:hypothetical protein
MVGRGGGKEGRWVVCEWRSGRVKGWREGRDRGKEECRDV